MHPKTTDRITRTEKLRERLIQGGARIVWRADAPSGEVLAYDTPKRGIVLVHDYGADGYDAYVPDQTKGTHIDVARALLGEN